jgi:hypothetical protein
MTPMEISHVVARAVTDAMEIPLEQVEEWRTIAAQYQSRHDTLDSMLDPTAYIKNKPAVDAALAIANAYANFRRTIEEVRA